MMFVIAVDIIRKGSKSEWVMMDGDAWSSSITLLLFNSLLLSFSLFYSFTLSFHYFFHLDPITFEQQAVFIELDPIAFKCVWT